MQITIYSHQVDPQQEPIRFDQFHTETGKHISLALIASGFGKNGSVAAQIAIDQGYQMLRKAKFDDPTDCIDRAFHKVHEVVLNTGDSHKYEVYTSLAICVIIDHHHMFTAHLGGCHIYYFTRETGQLRLMNRPHHAEKVSDLLAKSPEGRKFPDGLARYIGELEDIDRVNEHQPDVGFFDRLVKAENAEQEGLEGRKLENGDAVILVGNLKEPLDIEAASTMMAKGNPHFIVKEYYNRNIENDSPSVILMHYGHPPKIFTTLPVLSTIAFIVILIFFTIILMQERPPDTSNNSAEDASPTIISVSPDIIATISSTESPTDQAFDYDEGIVALVYEGTPESSRQYSAEEAIRANRNAIRIELIKDQSRDNAMFFLQPVTNIIVADSRDSDIINIRLSVDADIFVDTGGYNSLLFSLMNNNTTSIALRDESSCAWIRYADSDTVNVSCYYGICEMVTATRRQQLETGFNSSIAIEQMEIVSEIPITNDALNPLILAELTDSHPCLAPYLSATNNAD